MPGAADHFLVALLVLLLPPRAWISFRALRLASPERRFALRRRTYIAASISQWVLSILLLLYWARMRRSWVALGVLPVLSPGAIGITVGLAIAVTLMIMRARSGGEAAMLDQARERLAFAEPILPHTRGELALFRALSVTAGICEELLFRGFLIWYLSNYTGLIQAALLSSLAFGIGHAYQGPRGMAITAVVGAVMSALYLLSGSLVLPMVIHAAMDLHAGWLAYRVFGGAGPKGGAAGPTAAPA